MAALAPDNESPYSKEEEDDRAAAASIADALAEQARAEMIEASTSAPAGGGSGRPGRRQSALAGMGVFEGLKAGPTLGGAEEDASEEFSKVTVSEKSSANVADIMAADASDDSLRKYKELLLGAAAQGDLGDTSDPRKLVVTEFRVIFEDASVPDAVFDLSSEAGNAELKSKGLRMKEGANFKFQLSFRVNHQLLEALKFVNKTKRAVVGQTDELMIGSYAPSSQPHVFVFPRHGWNECPKGMMYRGTYTSTDAFIDSNGEQHLTYSYPLVIGKTW